jgi:beta-lactamase regulating signal transducer with metallopeptidase domain
MMFMSILNMSLLAGVMVLVIVAVRALALHKLSKRAFLALWSVALFRLTIPFTIPSRFSIYNLTEIVKEVTARTNAITPPSGVDSVASAMTTQNTANVILADVMSNTVSPVLVIWLIGVAVLALFFVTTHLRCRGDYKSALPIESEFVEEWLCAHPTKRKVEIRQSDKIAAPLTYGILRPIILLPKSTIQPDKTRLRYVLEHELTHIRRFDILSKWLLAAALCAHWFNPLVWVMYVLANRDIELSCDEKVVRTLGEETKATYALTLIELEERRSGLASLVSNFAKNAIEERIHAIMKIKKASISGILLAAVLVAGTATAFATSGVDIARFPVDDGSGFSRDAALIDGSDFIVVDAATMPAAIYKIPAEQKIVGSLTPGDIFITTATFAIAKGQPITFNGSWSSDFQSFEVGLYDTASGDYTWFRCGGGVLTDYRIAAEHDSISYKLAFRNPSANIYDTKFDILSFAIG